MKIILKNVPTIIRINCREVDLYLICFLEGLVIYNM